MLGHTWSDTSERCDLLHVAIQAAKPKNESIEVHVQTELAAQAWLSLLFTVYIWSYAEATCADSKATFKQKCLSENRNLCCIFTPVFMVFTQ